MEKLFHERLREAIVACERDLTTALIVEGEEYWFSVYKDEAEIIANEVEKYYIPRPRFEDGEPLQFDDKIVHPKTNEVVTIYSMHAFNDGCWCLTFKESDNPCYYLSANEYVKRPQEKIVDINGIKVEEGDIVWSTVDNRKGVVREQLKGYRLVTVEWDNGNKGLYAGDELTHVDPKLTILEKVIEEMERYEDCIISDWRKRLKQLN